MRLPVVVAAVMLAAAPAAAQQQSSLAEPAPAREATATAPLKAEPLPAALQVSRDQIDARLEESGVAEARQQSTSSFLYLAAAIAVGVIVALLILD